MEGGREQNYWPGFVDALSNVVLTLVFVIVIFVFALVMSADKVEKKMQQVVEAQEKMKEQSKILQETLELKKENELLKLQLKQDESALEKTHSTAAASSSSSAQTQEVDINVIKTPDNAQKIKSIGIKISGNKIVITYPLAVADLDAKSLETLEKTLEDFKNRLGKRKITINSIVGEEPFSAAQRYAYYRAINLRNYIISKGVSDNTAISSFVAQPSSSGGDRVEIIFGQ